MTHTVIRRRRGLAQIDFRELWQYRELLGFLAWRDISVRYRQTIIGVGWAFLRPFITMVVLTVVFGRLAGLPSDGVPYAVLTFTALVPWQFFATAFGEISNSVVGNGHMIAKIYMPRLLLPLASAGVATIDFLVSFGFLLLLLVHYKVPLGVDLAVLPLFALLCLTFTLGLGFWFAALFVKYRDVRHFIPFIIQLGFYVSPVAFSSSLVPERWRALYALNPMVVVIDGFRWSILGTPQPQGAAITIASAVSLLLFITGVLYFKTTERDFADIL